MRREPGTASLRDLLLWARASGFRITEVEMEGVRIAVDDLRIGVVASTEVEPRTPHEAWARQLGVTLEPDVDDDDDGEFAVPS